jgi:hypothetical protein
MLKKLILFILLIFLSLNHPHERGACLNSNSAQIYHGKLIIYIDHLSISIDGNIKLQKGIDNQCYNFTLPTVFSSFPGVAICTYMRYK